MPNDKHISKTLSLWLRHKPEAGGLTLSPEGWADVGAVLSAFAGRAMEVSRDDLDRVVVTNNKARFELSEDGAFIRARQGHSIDVVGAWERAEPPEFLYHGTVERFLPAIEAEGLQRMQRHHVHLSSDAETAETVGRRRGAPVILRVDAQRLAATGAEFFVTPNGVWLVDRVPPEFFKRIA